MLVNLLRIIHSVLITNIIYLMIKGDSISGVFVIGQLILTIGRAILEKRIKSIGSQTQILTSLVLVYYIFPNQYKYIGWIFLIKAVEIHKSLKSIRKSSCYLNQKGSNQYIAFFYDIIRYSVLQYIVLGISMLLYRYFADCKLQPLPPNHAIMYQLIVTASTIGYGDVVPKSDNQIIFLTYIIPIICASFVVYLNHLIEIFTKTFLEDQQIPVQID